MNTEPKPGHQLQPLDGSGGGLICTVCGIKVYPASYYARGQRPLYLKTGCPGVRVYDWSPWPEGLATQKQLNQKGLKPGALAGAIWLDKHSKWLFLYRENEAAPKPAPSPARQAAIAKTTEAQRVGRRCTRCGNGLSSYIKGGGLCEQCRDHDQARDWARQMLAEGFVVLDTETTGLNLAAQIVEIGIVRSDSRVLMDQRVRPTIPIPEDATAIHGIDDAAVAGAPTFAEIYDTLYRALHGRTVLIYNAAFDWPLVTYCRGLYALPGLGETALDCVMEWYAQWVGDWNYRRGNYRWQKLPSGDHSALGDAAAALRLIERMAAEQEQPTP